jgi:hypothetical protein
MKRAGATLDVVCSARTTADVALHGVPGRRGGKRFPARRLRLAQALDSAP